MPAGASWAAASCCKWLRLPACGCQLAYIQPASAKAPLRRAPCSACFAAAHPALAPTLLSPPPQVRMMLPMTVRCNVCGTFMYKVGALKINKLELVCAGSQC